MEMTQNTASSRFEVPRIWSPQRPAWWTIRTAIRRRRKSRSQFSTNSQESASFSFRPLKRQERLSRIRSFAFFWVQSSVTIFCCLGSVRLATDSELLRIRVAWIDCPELSQAFGGRAKKFMSALVFGKDVELRPHAIDRYGRTVAMVFVDDRDVGLELIKAGLAWG